MVSVLLFLLHVRFHLFQSQEEKKTIQQSKIVMFTLKLKSANDKNTRSFAIQVIFQHFNRLFEHYQNEISDNELLKVCSIEQEKSEHIFSLMS